MYLPFNLIRNIPKFNRNSFKICNRLFNNLSFEDITNVSPTFIKKTLSVNNVNFQEGHTCFMINCPQCKNNEIKRQAANLYINKTTGNFSCVSCLSHGQWPNLETYLNTKKTKKVKDIKILNVTSDLKTTQEYVQHVESNNTLLNTLPEEVILGVWKTFNFPSASHSAIESFNIRIDSTQKRLYFPLEDVHSRVVGYRILFKKSENEIEHNVEPSKNCIGILCGKSGKCKDAAILVPNISDFLVLLKSKTSHHIICLPNGYRNLPLHILSSLERFNKIILWFGNDINSWDSARNFSKKLGEKRCLFVRPSEKQPLPHLAAEKDIKAIVASAQTIWHKSITTFSSLKEDVLLELQNVDKVHGVKWKRFPTLNKLLKGHRRGELTVLTGPTGCGKTTFVSEYSLDLAMQGINTLWGSFEIRNVSLAKTMLQQFAELPLDKHIDRFEEFAIQFEKLPMYFMTFHGQQSVKVVMEAMEHAQYVHDIAHVVIDNVQFMMGIGDGEKHLDRFWKQDVIISAFRNFATKKNCHVTLIIHPRKERTDEDLTTSSIFGGAKASQEADNILILQDKSFTVSKGKKYIQVSKNRYSGDLGLMQLDFDKNSKSFAQKKKKEDKVNESKLASDS